MRNQKIYRYMLLITLLVAISLSCKTITKPFEKFTRIATDIEDIMGIATDIDVEGLATNIDIGGMETKIQPMITNVQGFITQMPDMSGEKPTDVPIIEGGQELMSSKGLISYSTKKEFREVVNFYESQMPANGWTKTESKVEEYMAELVFQKGARKAKVSIVSIPMMGGVTVSITIEGG